MVEIGALPMALFLAVFVKAALDRVASLVRARWPEADLGLPFGVAAIVLGGVLGWLAGINVLEGLPLDPVLGRVLTAIAVGLGVEFLNDVLATVQGRRGSDVVVEPAAPAEVMGIAGEARVLRVRRIGPARRGW